MQEKLKGIVLKLIDYGEADKLAQIFSLEQGIVTAKFNGVRKEKAKLKAVAQPFVLANFCINQTGKSTTITQADVIDEFGGILLNYSKTMSGFVVLDIVHSILPVQKPEADLFLLTISALKNIETLNEYVATIDYILKFLSFTGVELNFPHSNYVYLDELTGNFVLNHTQTSHLIDKKVFFLLNQINMQGNNFNAEQTSQLVFKQALNLLHNIILLKHNADIKSFEFII